ncbi:MAG: response regulator [Chloroflexi bacterium]|nr:response regulator [Chloroflexota bacterium]
MSHILVIDDDPIVCEVVTDILEIEDIPTIIALNGQEGLEAYRQRIDDISLILLDLTMPGMNGEETLRALRQINPQAQIILSSGYEKATSEYFTELGAAGFLQKPYSLVTLLGMVGKHLG